ncbi:ferritin-like domain-containing protein [Pandoraea nosoerga]|uniref:Uncharacterized protein n=1 Tax=Pandoraea nosoerga TaxID=2508296 RepID=A0A5E4RH91_9BURK|nr:MULTISPECIES: ferritin-like domain-containing protein [Pandoraea]MBN4664447.1 ferritin-like domain-containing protein [Pandoraea nosoerga]MBN4674517.1 ferritin-like domain-containing protein [Pandoraea nosoerga]MBN4679785.1 ferritin-like domain-containing protein [Pandoraea nosoerga]MBN4743127.1 ferritin-like domain-containing protein [Pandoraea nosoerga]VVD62577.1 hypothetical protein PNO31109_00175 [Pandoraea nosoerga]
MNEAQDHLIDWLRDAYAMEKHAETMLKAQASRLEHYPELKARIEQHIEETIGQQKSLEACLDSMGSSPSTMKDLAGRIGAFGQALGGGLASDEVVKGAMAGYVFENIEIAAYTTLIAAARTCGRDDVRETCEMILPQEVEMARWLLEHLPHVTGAYLTRDAMDEDSAKR